MKAILFTILLLSCLALWSQDLYWGVRADGNQGNEVRDVTSDAAGNVYVAGTFMGIMDIGAYTLTSGTSTDLYVAKYDPDGTCLWAVKAGGNSLANANSLALDNSGNIFIAGSIVGTAYFGDIPVTGYGSNDVAVAKLTNDGVWQWAVHGGSSGYDCAYGIVTDAGGNAYVTGAFSGTSSFGVNLTSAGSTDAFIAKINPFGSWIWASRGGGASGESAQDIAIDSDDNLYITGLYEGNSLFGNSNLPNSGSYDIFVAKSTSTGLWIWAIRAGGTDDDRGTAISVDQQGNCYITGYFVGTADFNVTTLTSLSPIYFDVFVAKVGALGAWLWAKKGGGSEQDIANDIDADASGNCYVTGYFNSTAYFGENGLTAFGGYNLFIAKISSSGNWFWAGSATGTDENAGACLCSRTDGSVIMGGYFHDTISFADLIFISADPFDSFIYCFGDPVPAIPQNITIENLANDIHLHWDEVDSDNNGHPLTPDYYFIYYNYDQVPGGDYYFLDYTPAYIRNYVHQYAGLYSTEYFYNVTAVKVYGDNLSRQELDAYLDEHLHEGMSKAEVEAVLKDINLK